MCEVPHDIQMEIDRAVSVATPDEVIALADSCRAVFVRRLSDPIAAVLSERVALRVIMQDGSPTISDRGIVYLARLPQLEWLDLEWSTQLTDAALESLVGISSLRYLDVDFCSGLSQARLDWFRACRPDVRLET